MTRSLHAAWLALGALTALGAPSGCAGAPKPVDRDRATKLLDETDVSACREGKGPRGLGHVTIVFEPSGDVQTATVDGGPFVGTEAGRCIEATFRTRRIPPFTGPALKLGRSFRLD